MGIFVYDPSQVSYVLRNGSGMTVRENSLMMSFCIHSTSSPLSMSYGWDTMSKLSDFFFFLIRAFNSWMGNTVCMQLLLTVER